MKGLTLTEREQMRMVVLNQVLEHTLDVASASRVLGVSERHAWRILAAYRKEGAAALAHGNRGRRPVNALEEELAQAVVRLAQERYPGVNHSHLTELLAEREGISLARTTVRGLLVRAGLRSLQQRRPPRHRVRRERLPQEGMLLQIDGSHHDWLQERGPRLTLLLAVDDATGTFPWGLFRKEEDALGYLLLAQGIIERRGIPLALYSDRHAVFRPVLAPPGSRGEATQFGRAMRELGVTQVFAMTPQAKGRIERANKTFQDRLVAELTLAGASTEADANRVLWEFLPRISQRFGVPAAHPGSAYRSVGPALDLAATLCCKFARKVAKDNTVKFRQQTLQLLPSLDHPTYASATVEVQVRLDGTLVVCHEGRLVSSRAAPPRPAFLRDRVPRTDRGDTRLPDDLTRGAGARTNGAEGRGRTCKPTEPPPVPSERRSTPKQQARWDAVQAARRQGLSVSAISRNVGIDRKTARKYATALFGPPTHPGRRPPQTDNESVTNIEQDRAGAIGTSRTTVSLLTESLAGYH